MFVIRRDSHNPLIAPRREYPWEALAAFNPSAAKVEGGTRIYYRALANPEALVSPYAGQSTIGMAFSEDGTHFHSRRQVLIPGEAWDAYGCEDPRATLFEGKWYVFYTALGGYPFGPDNIKVGVAISDDGEHFGERHLVTPFNAKAATLFPERVDGDVVLMLTAHTDWTADHPRPTIAFARSKRIEDFWDPKFWLSWHEKLEDHALANLRRADADHIEAGAAPVKTEQGWLLIYSYIQRYYDEKKRLFGVEAALLDLHDPRKLISRTYPFLVPEEIYERYGVVPNIVFPTGAVRNGAMLDLYYGAADTTCARASVRFADLMDALTPCDPPLARAPNNPLLEPTKNAFETRDVFNPAAIDLGGSVHLLYRAMGDDNTSTIGYARSEDGIHIDERLDEPCYAPRADFEMKHGPANGNSGCEDPRVVAIGDRVYMTYTAYDGARAPHGAISSIAVDDFLAKRFDRWSEPALTTPEGVDDKDLALLPEPVDGNYLLYHRIGGRVCADLVPDLSFTKRVSRCIEILGPREGMWDAAKVGIGAPPIKVQANGKDAWLMIYHGVSDRAHYRLGAALLDASGTIVLARTADPLFEPVEKYEIEGDVKNVVFACGAVVRGDTLYVYYGGGDRVVGAATGSLSRILAALS
jgi:predicted GH43/DUF377 family glycosyl hydrolase